MSIGLTAQMVWEQIQRVPWTIVLFQIEQAAFMAITWALTRHHYARAWARYAPVRARTLIRRLRRANRLLRQREYQQRTIIAELRGQLAAIQQGLEKPERTPLLFARGRLGQG